MKPYILAVVSAATLGLAVGAADSARSGIVVFALTLSFELATLPRGDQ